MALSILALALMGLAGAVEQMDISGKTYTDFPIFNGTDILEANEDLGGTSLSDMGIDTNFFRDNPNEGKPINQSKPVLLLGNQVVYNRVEPVFYTPAEFDLYLQTKNVSPIVRGVS